MQECLANTGDNIQLLTLLAGAVIVLGVTALLISKHKKMRTYVWLAGLLVSALFVSVSGSSTFAATQGTQCGDASSQPTTDPGNASKPSSKPGETQGAAGETQTFNALSHATPSKGHKFVNSSLMLSAVSDPVDGTSVSSDGKKVTVPGEGVYVANSNGTITFTPADGFSGKAKGVMFMLKDTSGQQTRNLYTPTVAVPACTQLAANQWASFTYNADGNGNITQTSATQGLDNIFYYANADLPNLSQQDVEALAPYIDLDPSQAGIQYTIDKPSQGWKASINVATGQITRTITDTANNANRSEMTITITQNPRFCGTSATVASSVSIPI